MIIIIPLVIIVIILAWVLRPKEKLDSSCRVALTITILLPAVLAIAAVVFQLMQNAVGDIFVSDISNTLFVIGLFLIGLGILVSVGLAFLHKKEIARSIGFGLCFVFFITVLELGLLEWLAGV